MLNPTDYTFNVGIYTDLSLEEVHELVFNKLTEYEPDNETSLRDEYTILKNDHFYLMGNWEQKVGIREQIINKAVEIINIVDGPKSANPNIEQVSELEEIETIDVTSIEVPPIDDGLIPPIDIETYNSGIDTDPNINAPIRTSETPIDDIIEQPIERSDEEDRKSNESDFNPVELTQLEKPTIKPIKIKFPTKGMSKRDKEQFGIGLGQVPLVYYNGVHIEYNRIKTFSLYHEGILPAISMSFTDQAEFRDIGFPTDNISITIFIYSRSKKIRSVYMDFKVTNMRDHQGLVHITGIADIPEIYLIDFKAYRDKTSLQTMRDVAKKCKLGFNTNISSTNDKQTWVNPGKTRKKFIENITKNAYISDSSFVVCYIDFYYNLCFMDLEKEIGRDISNDLMRLSSGKSELTEEDIDEEKVVPVILTTDKSALDTNCHVTEVDILNQSTRVSLNKGYLTKTRFYDSNNKEMLMFDIDTISNDRNKLSLKSKKNDTYFYKENSNAEWVGKMDKYDNGTGNVHDNYNYALIHNKVNRTELNKIDIDIKLDVPNYNFYLYQKIRFELIYDVPGAVSTSIKHERISGEAIINSIEYTFDGNKFYQNIGLIRRDLEKTEEEIKNTVEERNFTEQFQDNENPLGPNDDLPQNDIVDDVADVIDEVPTVPPIPSDINGENPDFWTLVAVASREDSDPQARADIAQSIYNRVNAEGYPNSIRSVIIQNWAYEPTWRYPRNSTQDGLPNPEWLNIKDAQTAAEAAGWNNIDVIQSTADSILNQTLQSNAAKFVEGRTDFLSETQGTPDQRNAKDPTRLAIMREENRPNNVFAWNYNYKDNIAYTVPNWESFGIVSSNLA